MNKVEKYKKEYIRSDVVMSEFLRSCDDLTVDEKRELLHWAGEDDLMEVTDDANVVEKQCSNCEFVKVDDGRCWARILNGKDGCVNKNKYKEKKVVEQPKFAVIEITGDYTVCFGSGLSWADASSIILEQMYHDGYFTKVRLFNLECNDTGLGVECFNEAIKRTYYILEDPGRDEIR